VLNHPGAGGAVAARTAAQAAPDGYTLYMPASSAFVTLPGLQAGLPLEVPRDFLPVGFVALQPFLLAVVSSLGSLVCLALLKSHLCTQQMYDNNAFAAIRIAQIQNLPMTDKKTTFFLSVARLSNYHESYTGILTKVLLTAVYLPRLGTSLFRRRDHPRTLPQFCLCAGTRGNNRSDGGHCHKSPLFAPGPIGPFDLVTAPCRWYAARDPRRAARGNLCLDAYMRVTDIQGLLANSCPYETRVAEY
jgi:Tripartite tricarboxylate transporter family receptor